MKSNSRKCGFTLVELCIVIALLGMMMAAGVVAYGPLKEKMQDHTAERQLYNIREAFLSGKNMASAGGQLSTTTFTLNVGKNATDAISVYVENRMDDQLPEMAGAYTVEAKSVSGVMSYTIRYNANGKVYILNENGTVSVVSGFSLGDAETMEKVLTALSSIGPWNLDSNAIDVSGSSHAQEAYKALLEQGLDMAAMGAVTWHYDTSNKILLWSMQDIHDMLGQKIPVMRYNSKTGTYTVWTTVVTTASSASGGGGRTYNIIPMNISSYAPSTSQNASLQTYDNMVEKYQQAMREMGYA